MKYSYPDFVKHVNFCVFSILFSSYIFFVYVVYNPKNQVMDGEDWDDQWIKGLGYYFYIYTLIDIDTHTKYEDNY